MAEPIFKTGINGLSDSLWSGTEGSCSKLVGIDYRTKPGTFQAHQKLSKHSSTTIDELCKNVVNCSDGSRLWFSSESGKIWREVSGTYTLVHTTVPTAGEAKCLGATEYHGEIFWATELYLHKILVEDLGDWTKITQNWKKFAFGDDSFHPMTVQNLQLYIGDKTTIAKVDKPPVPLEPKRTMTTTFDASIKYIGHAGFVAPFGNEYPTLIYSKRETLASGTGMTFDVTIPDKSNRVMVMYLSSFNASTVPFASMVTAPTLGAQSIGLSFTSSTVNFGGSSRASVEAYRLNNPNSGTNTVTLTFGATETNVVVTIMVFDKATMIGNNGFDSSGSGGTQFSESNIGTVGVNYQLPIAHVFSESGIHTNASSQISVFNANNTWGTDSTSYFGELPDFTQKTEFNVVAPERIQTIKDFDIDILVGTRDVNKGRVLRWDGVSEGWSAQDDIEEQGINAFIRDDNYMYVQAGFYGRMYFYNGEKLDPFKRIPGDWSPTKTAKINPNASAFHLGVPVFGLSNVAGNPTLQGVYGFGSYGAGYPKTLSLDFPIPTNVFEGVEIGSMVADGADLYVSYKDATDVGVAKLDWANKYNGAYLETNALMGTENRSDFTNIDAVNVDYTDLPTSTGITIAYKKNYDSTFTTLSGITFPKLKQVKARETITDIANLILKISLTTSTNSTPNVENVSIGL
jgi:hypothetical protein